VRPASLLFLRDLFPRGGLGEDPLGVVFEQGGFAVSALVLGGFAMSALVFCFWVYGRSPKLSPSNTPRSLRIKFEEVIDHATARHNARWKIVREVSDGRRLINELEQIVVHACWELLSCLAS
jgi:hypothetical protein